MELKVEEEILLKSVQLDDVEMRYSVINTNRQYLKKWLGWLDLYKELNDLVNYTKICQQKEKNNESYALAIYYKGNFVGSIEIQDINYRNKKCEIGYWLAKEYLHNGIMIKSCNALINYIFDVIKLNKINILVATENYASQAIPKKLGFIKEGILEENEYLYGKYVDNYIYGITKKRWENRKNERN